MPRPDLTALLAAALIGLGLPAQASGPAPVARPPAGPVTAPALTTAQVVEVYRAEGRILLAHQDMPHLGMSAMTMEFLATPSLLRGLQKGDRVLFDARREGDEHRVVRLRRLP